MSGPLEKLGDEALVKELALQLWGGTAGGDAYDKAREMLPWLKQKFRGIRNSAYMEGRIDAYEGMKEALDEAMKVSVS